MPDDTRDGQREGLTRFKKAAKRVTEEIKPWAEFVGPMSIPRLGGQKPELGQRLHVNLSFFKMNYILIMVALCIYHIITNPGLAFIFIFFSSLYFLVLLMAIKPPIVIGDFMPRVGGQLIVVSVLFILVLGLTGYILRIRVPLAIGGIVCFLHAAFRPPVSRALASRDGDTETMEDILLNMEGGSFLQANTAQDPHDLPANANIRLRSRPLPNAKYSSRPPPKPVM
eukprot:507519_1